MPDSKQLEILKSFQTQLKEKKKPPKIFEDKYGKFVLYQDYEELYKLTDNILKNLVYTITGLLEIKDMINKK